ncbi:MAG TPA: NAD(+)/NADH kinase [Candidatus Saccharimonadales bacterium]|nr:NAD(+)/NADH kinase [Candidatus Saccharimonadales bacterium]
MKVKIVVGNNNKVAEDLASKIHNYLLSKKQEIVEKVEDADMVITLGGDGTLIHTACEYAALDVPFVGINAGTLGFLTAEEGDDWQKAVDLLIAGKYTVSERMTVEASVAKGDSFQAVNEVVVKGLYRVVKLEILVNGQKLLNTSGDGVIVATQTGSTAYSLSAGGPIVDPGLDCLLITPVNAHGLPIPSMVLSPNDEIDIKISSGENISLIIDGQEHTKVSQSQSVKVKRGKNKVKLVYFGEHHFLKALNAKFGLGGRLQ